jgi:hypothetical protein
MLISERHQRCRIDSVVRRGHEYVSLENESLRVTFVVSKGADLVEFRHKPTDVDAMWHSPHPLNPPGSQVPTMAAARGSFFDHYEGGWQEVMPAGGGPCTYKGAEIGLHGEATFLPWRAEVLDDSPERVSVRFSVALRRTPFIIERNVTLEEGEPVISWRGRVRNDGEETLHFMWGQHICFGEPFIAPGCEIDLPAATVKIPDTVAATARFVAGQEATWPELRTVEGGSAQADTVLPKEARTLDTYTIVPRDGWFAVRNRTLDLGLMVSWDRDVYPYLWAWQVYGGAWGYPFYGRAYALGLEPFSSPAGSLTANVERGTAAALEAGQEAVVSLRAGFFTGARDPVRGLDGRGRARQGEAVP